MTMDGNVLIGREIGNYRITQELNSGAYGSVYKAEHMHLKGRIVAIKLLHTYLGSPQEREQFTQEAQFLVLLEHSHILSVLDFGFSERQPYLVAQYAAGGSLRDRLRQQAPLPIEQAIIILTQIGQALHHAHQQQIIHRDLKPENILFDVAGNALLADFGIATMLSTASVKNLTNAIGTPTYMAPEQFQGVVSREGDQYALGCIAYELLTGQRPFTAPDFISLAFKHLSEPPQRPIQLNPKIPTIIDEAILKALAKQRTERYSDVLAFLNALQSPFSPTILNASIDANQATILKAEQSGATGPSSRLHTDAPKVTDQASALKTDATASAHQVTDMTTTLLPTPSTETIARLMSAAREDYAADNEAEALSAYEEVIRLDPRYASAHNGKGNVLYSLRRYKEALLAYEEATRLNPTDAIFQFNKGNALLRLQRYQETLIACEEALRLDPNYADAHNGKGKALFALGRNEEALVSYKRAIHFKSDKGIYHENKGDVLYRFQRYGEALASYEQAIRLKSYTANVYFGEGNVLSILSRDKEALSAYERALLYDPRHIEALNGKGSTLHALGRYEEALEVYEQVLRLQPQHKSAHNGKGKALYRLGDSRESLREYEEALRLDPHYAHAHHNKGVMLYKLGKHKEALAAFDEAIRCDPTMANAYFQKGNVLYHLRRNEEAQVAFEEAIRYNLQNAEIYTALANTLQRLKLYEGALTAIERAIQFNPDKAELYMSKRDILKALGRRAEAREAFNKAQQLSNNSYF